MHVSLLIVPLQSLRLAILKRIILRVESTIKTSCNRSAWLKCDTHSQSASQLLFITHSKDLMKCTLHEVSL